METITLIFACHVSLLMDWLFDVSPFFHLVRALEQLIATKWRSSSIRQLGDSIPLYAPNPKK